MSSNNFVSKHAISDRYYTMLLTLGILAPILITTLYTIPGTWDDLNRTLLVNEYNGLSGYFNAIKDWIIRENGRYSAAATCLLPFAYTKLGYAIINAIIFLGTIYSLQSFIDSLSEEQPQSYSPFFATIIIFSCACHTQEIASLFFNLSRTSVYLGGLCFFFIWLKNYLLPHPKLKNTIFQSVMLIIAVGFCEAIIVPVLFICILKIFPRKIAKSDIVNLTLVTALIIWVITIDSNEDRTGIFIYHGDMSIALSKGFEHWSSLMHNVFFQLDSLILILFTGVYLSSRIRSNHNASFHLFILLICILSLSVIFAYSKGSGIQSRFENFQLILMIGGVIIFFAQMIKEQFKLNAGRIPYMNLLFTILFLANIYGTPYAIMVSELINFEIQTAQQEIYDRNRIIQNSTDTDLKLPVLTFKPKTTFIDHLSTRHNHPNNVIFQKLYKKDKIILDPKINMSCFTLMNTQNFSSINDSLFYHYSKDYIAVKSHLSGLEITKDSKFRAHIFYDKRNYWTDLQFYQIEEGTQYFFIRFPAEKLKKLIIRMESGNKKRRILELNGSLER